MNVRLVHVDQEMLVALGSREQVSNAPDERLPSLRAGPAEQLLGLLPGRTLGGSDGLTKRCRDLRAKILWGDGQLSIGRLGSGHLDQEAAHGICRDARITC